MDTDPWRQGKTDVQCGDTDQHVLLAGDQDFSLPSWGRTPNDPSQPNYAEICTVEVANTGSSITVDTPVPYAISQGSLSNTIQRITDLVQNVSIQDLGLNFVDGTTPDANISPLAEHYAKGVDQQHHGPVHDHGQHRRFQKTIR